jgi:cyclase
MKKVLIAFICIIALALVAGGTLYTLYLRPFMKKMEQVTTIPYDKNLTLVMGGGGNSGILVSDSVVLVIDTKMNDAALQLSKTVKDLAGNKPIIVVNTHVHTDHTAGNKYYAGQTIIVGGNYDKDFWAKDAGAEAPPTDWVKDSLVLNIGDETVTILNLPFPAHTQSDIVVYLHNRKMLFGGDVILNKQSPAMFSKYRADPYGYLKAFDLVESRFDIARVVPGHGNLGGVEVIDNYRTFFNDMKAAAADPSIKAATVAKYKDYGQIPLLMSPGAAINSFKSASAK